MSQDPADRQPGDEQPPPWVAPTGDSPPASPEPPPSGGTEYGKPPYGQPPYGQPQYGQPQYGQPGSAPPPGYAPPPAQAPPLGYGPPAGYPPPAGYGAPGGGPWGPPPADKPGVVPLRPLAVSEILDGAFATIRMNPKAMLGLSFVVVLVGQLAVLAINLAVRTSSDAARLSVLPITTAITVLVSSIVTGAIIVVIGEAVLGTKISPEDALGRLRGRIWRLVGIGLLVGVIVAIGLLLLIIPGIYLAVLLAFATPVFVLEKSTVGGALRRSSELVRGSWWRTLGIGFLGYLVGSIVSGLVQIPFALVAAHSSGVLTSTSANVSAGGEVLLTIGRVIGGTISTPIIAGTIALLYIDRRMRREGLDITLAEAARERRASS